MMLIVLLETRWSWPTPCSSLSTPPCRIESICASACPWRWSEWRNIETIQGGCSHWDALEQAIGSIWNLSCQQYSFHLHWSPWSFWVKLNSCISSYFFWRSFSRIFNDFGSKFEVIDATGEEPLTGMVAAITNVSQSQQWESYGLLTLCIGYWRCCHMSWWNSSWTWRWWFRYLYWSEGYGWLEQLCSSQGQGAWYVSWCTCAC